MNHLADLLKEAAAPITRDEKIDAVIRRAADRCGISYSRAFNIWYGRAKWTTAEETEAVACAVDQQRRQSARNELHELRTRIAIMESRLNQMDQDFYSATIDALRPYYRPAGA